jgi:Double zinc ribbon
MPDCPRCHHPVDPQAIACPQCRTTLKAFGHPGIPLYRAIDQDYLCPTCTYHADDTCNFPQRPYARECTLYQNQHQPPLTRYTPNLSSSIQGWLNRNAVWIVLLGIALISILLVLSKQ